jgi:hypothetical protein
MECIEQIPRPYLLGKQQTHDICLKAVKREGLELALVKEPSFEIMKEAVMSNGHAIQYVMKVDIVDEVKHALAILAMNNNGLALRHIENPDEETVTAALENNGQALRFIKNPTVKMEMAAVKQNGFNIIYVKIFFNFSIFNIKFKNKNNNLIKF